MKQRRAAAADVRRQTSGCRSTAARWSGRRRTGGAGGVPEALATEPSIFIYDNYPGGIGFSEPLFDMHDELLDADARADRRLPVPSGCPSCVGPEGNTGPNAKPVALRILGALVAGEAA